MNEDDYSEQSFDFNDLLESDVADVDHYNKEAERASGMVEKPGMTRALNFGKQSRSDKNKPKNLLDH